MKYFNSFIIFALILLCACSKTHKEGTIGNNENIMKHASQLIMNENDGFTVVKIKNPSDSSEILAKYILVSKSQPIPENLPEGVVIRTPISSALVYTSVHAGVLKELGEIDIVKAVVDAMFYKIPEIKDGLSTGNIADVGNSASPVIEKIIELSPEVIMLSVYDGMNSATVENLGIPILRFTDNFEKTPLGRAEWIKFFGALTEKKSPADSIFNEVKNRYESLAKLADKTVNRPKVLVENMYQGIWYVSGGDSYQAKMIKDAGGNYAWADDKSTGSLNLSFEQVYDCAADADIWLLKVFGKDLTKAELKAMDERNLLFKAVDNGGVYYANTSEVNLFEEFPFHPELQLADYIKIFHPELLSDHKMRYFKNMNN